MNKIMIIGSGGAGKSTLARKLGEKLNIEVFHLDSLLWRPNWEMVSREEQREIQNDLIKKEQWIIDGNYGGTMDVRLEAADTIIFMDFPRVICLYRAVKRYFQYRGKSRPDMVEGNDERLDWNFLKWIWNYPRDKRPGILKTLEWLALQKQVVILHSPKEADLFLSELQKSK